MNVHGLLTAMLDPVSLAIAQAPFDDEPETDEERQAVAEADAWLKNNKPIPIEEHGRPWAHHEGRF